MQTGKRLISAETFDSDLSVTIVLPSRSPRASPETSQSRSGMRRLRTWLVTKSRGPRVTVRLHYERRPKARRGRASEGKPRKQGSRMMPVHKRKTVRGTERRGGAPRGGRPASWDVRRDASRLRAYVTGPLQRVPLHPSACRRSAPSPYVEGIWQTSEERMPRENDQACADLRGLTCPHFERKARQPAGKWIRARGLTP